MFRVYVFFHLWSQIFQGESIFYSKISSGGFLFIKKLVRGDIQFGGIHFYHDRCSTLHSGVDKNTEIYSYRRLSLWNTLISHLTLCVQRTSPRTIVGGWNRERLMQNRLYIILTQPTQTDVLLHFSRIMLSTAHPHHSGKHWHSTLHLFKFPGHLYGTLPLLLDTTLSTKQ